METLLLKVSVLQEFANLFSNIGETKWQMVLMWAVGGLLIYLAIAKQIIALHGGDISVVSNLGFGTEFIILLPYGAGLN